MAKNKKTRRVKGHTKPKEKQIAAQSDSWIQELKNERFEEYYRAQKLMPPDEWPRFLQTLREPLPTTFRLAGSRETAHELNNIIRSTYVPQLSDVTFEGAKVTPPIQIPWYPEGLAWHLNVPKSVIRRSPEFKWFHNFLVYETDVGNISRQEAVSMIPPLFLDVRPHHFVLDMCAAPGSKTAQLLEAMHAPSSTGGSDACHIPPGLLIANDSDFKRTHLLVHQSSRLPSPALMVTNLDASNYPNIFLAPPSPAISSTSAACPQLHQTLKFDRILCDVPCSGDGTLRKNIGIWGHWQPMDANGLHGLQLRILLRAMKLLRPAGRIVYSTCSLNPVENEAVVAAALNAAADFELVDVSSQLPSLVRKPGLEAWFPVVDKDLNSFPSYRALINEVRNKDAKVQQNQIKMMETHWPPQNVAELNLNRCLRIYPHLQDMGGFFVAVLTRKNVSLTGTQTVLHKPGKRAASQEAEVSAPDTKRVKEANVTPHSNGEAADVDTDIPEDHLRSVLSSNQPEALEEIVPRPALKYKSGKESDGKFKEPPYTFLEPDHPQLRQTIQRLNLLPSFPTSNVFVRNPEGGASTVPLRSMYLCNDIVKRVILANDYTKIRLVAAGTKAFTRQDTGSFSDSDDEDEQAMMRQQFRILDDAVPVVLPFIPPATVLPGQLNDLKLLLEAYYPLMLSFDEPFRLLLGSKEKGNHLIRFEANKRNGAVLNHDLVLPVWKSNASLSLMIDKKSKSALSLRVFGEDVTVFGKQMVERQAANQGRREAAAAAKGVRETSESEHGMDVEGVDRHNEGKKSGIGGSL